MESGAIQNSNSPDIPPCSAHVAIDRDEAFSYLADPRHLAGWWFRPGRGLDAEGSRRVHFDSEAGRHRIELRWGEDGDWRHMRVEVAEEGAGSRVTVTVLPVPGCPEGCLEVEAIRAKRDLKRLVKVLLSRAHLLGSDDYWI